ncbi:hypothetical protein AALO_G00092110 [Alosa alosa]|uniref:Pyrin domain-containing protein n=1 Tax=Alosa alosa TaxID=278164 RepID=A0AAV6GTM7_9TELE|nr:hypothetical protein AALO_G00092110 [Alosa alosa]
MKDAYGEEGSVKITLTILKKMNLNDLAVKLEERPQTQTPPSPVPMKNDESMPDPLTFKQNCNKNPVWSLSQKVSIMAVNALELLCETLDELETADLKRFRTYLSERTVEELKPIPKGNLEDKCATDVASIMKDAYEGEGSVKMTLTILRKMNLNDLADKLQERAESAERDDAILQEVIAKHKKWMIEKFGEIHECIEDKKNKTLLRKIYTELYITEGESEGVNTQHEQEIQQYMNSGKELSPAQCSTLAYIILVSEDALDEFDLIKYKTTSEGRKRLLIVLKACRKARLVGFDLREDSCEVLTSALQSENSLLKELDLSSNPLRDSGVRLLSVGLKHTNCRLERLRLCDCKITHNSCEIVASVLQSTNSLIKLDLGENDLGDSGVKFLLKALCSPHCKLQTLSGGS